MSIRHNNGNFDMYRMGESGGSWTAEKGTLLAHETPADLWAAALSIGGSACRGEVVYRYLVDPENRYDRLGSQREQVFRASQTREVIMVLFPMESSRRGTIMARQPAAFIMAKMTPGNLYIDVVCGLPGFGGKIIDAFLWFADRVPADVTLSALPTVVWYYPKYGFSFRKNCSEKALDIPDELKERLNARVRARNAPRTAEDTYDDRDWSDLLLLLQRNGLNVYKGEGCNQNASKQRIKSSNCGVDGFSMSRCKRA